MGTSVILEEEIDFVSLWHALRKHFNLEELKTIAYLHLEIPDDDLPSHSLKVFARELVFFCKRRKILGPLIAFCCQENRSFPIKRVFSNQDNQNLNTFRSFAPLPPLNSSKTDEIKIEFLGHTVFKYTRTICIILLILLGSLFYIDQSTNWPKNRILVEQDNIALLNVELTAKEEVKSATFKTDGTLVTTTNINGQVRIWNVDSGELLTTLEGSINPTSPVVFSGDGQLIATSSNEGNIQIWDVESNKYLTYLENNSAINSMAFSPDANFLATVDLTGNAKLWNINTGASIGNLNAYPNDATFVDFSPDGKFIITAGNDNIARLWNVPTLRLATRFEHDNIEIVSINFSPEGKRIVTVSSQGMVRNWDITTGQLISSFTSKVNNITLAKLSPDGNLIAVAGSDGIVRFWNIETGKFLYLIRHNDTEPILDISFGLNKDQILTVNSNGTLYVWRAEHKLNGK